MYFFKEGFTFNQHFDTKKTCIAFQLILHESAHVAANFQANLKKGSVVFTDDMVKSNAVYSNPIQKNSTEKHLRFIHKPEIVIKYADKCPKIVMSVNPLTREHKPLKAKFTNNVGNSFEQTVTAEEIIHQVQYVIHRLNTIFEHYLI